ncbi:MAG TPA: VOC family protein [Mycobacteriales bacterium]|nr:VOC family protein [Mycobacteriales bacterium]
MTVTARRTVTVLDAADIVKVSEFYAALTGWEFADKDDDWITLKTGDGQYVAFQLAPDHIPPQWPGQEHPQQYHLDLYVADPEAAAGKAVTLGATRLGAGAAWVTLADPAGHPFDLCRKDDAGDEISLFTATIDAPDAAGLARFYADLTGMEVTYEGPEGALIAGDGRNLMFQQIADYTPPQWPDPAHPQQGHTDVFIDDLDAGEARALELGATRLPGQGRDFRVYADPAGHPFCLCIWPSSEN